MNCWRGAHALFQDRKVLRETSTCMAQTLKDATLGGVATDILIIVVAAAGVIIILALVGMAGMHRKTDSESNAFFPPTRNAFAAESSGNDRQCASYGDRSGPLARQNSRGSSRVPCAPGWGSRQHAPPLSRENTDERITPPQYAPQPMQAAPQYQQALPPVNMSSPLGGSRARQIVNPPSLTTPSPASPKPGSSNTLCPGLMVPRGAECVLAVPIANIQGPQQTSPFSVKELSGQPVINVETIPASWGNTGERKIITLRTARTPSALIAYCKAADAGAGRRSVYMYDSHDELFGHITKVMALQGSKMGRYVFTSARAGLQLQFEGNFREHSMQIQSGEGEMIADTEPYQVSFDPSGVYYKLRVVANNDVGLLLCALLSIEHMESP